MPARTLSICLVGALAFALSACSPSPSGDAAGSGAASAASSATNPRAQKSLTLYQGLRAKGSYALAAPIGAGVVKRHPKSAAAKEIQKTLADTQRRADAVNKARRLKGLWLYQTGEQSGAQQATASIKPSRPASAHGRIELVLRRHAEWGQSAYLYDHGSNAGFVCKGHCTLKASFDGKPHKLEAFLPDTNDPAIFIEHDKRFIAAMKKADTIEITVQLRDGGTPTLTFEVAGFDPKRWSTPPQ